MSWPETYATKWPRRNERPAGPVPLLERIVADVPRLPGALCVGRPEPFDADRLDDAATAAQALELCDRCPALSACRCWAVSQPPGRLVGIVAGAWYLPAHNGAQNGAQP